MIRHRILSHRSLAAPSLVALLLAGVACSPAGGQGAGAAPAKPAAAAPAAPQRAVATFAMGCFWCAEDAFEGHVVDVLGAAGHLGGAVGARGRGSDPVQRQLSFAPWAIQRASSARSSSVMSVMLPSGIVRVSTTRSWMRRA